MIARMVSTTLHAGNESFRAWTYENRLSRYAHIDMRRMRLRHVLRSAILCGFVRSEKPMATLIVLLHGVGQTPADMAPLADLVAAHAPHAVVAAPPAAWPYDRGPTGFQWFSVDGITEENRPGRIRVALPAFAETVEALQRAHGAGPEETLLAGFSQGAIMTLAACEGRFLARHAVAIAGRCAPLPEAWERRTRVRLVHGRHDGTVPLQHSERAFERLTLLGADVRLDVVPRAVHRLASPLLDRAWQALQEGLQEGLQTAPARTGYNTKLVSWQR